MKSTTKFWMAVAAYISLVWLWSWTDRACFASGEAFRTEMDKAASCGEFWLNRYQSLIGNALTASVAAATLLWIARQLDVSHQQSAVAAASALRVKIPELKEEIAFYQSCKPIIAAHKAFAQAARFAEPFPSKEQWGSMATEFYRLNDQVVERMHMHSGEDQFDRRRLSEGLIDCAGLAKDLHHQFGNCNPKQVAKNLRIACNRTGARLQASLNGLNLDLQQTWRAIRAFERDATRVR